MWLVILSFNVFYRLNRELRSLCFKLRGIIPRRGLTGDFKSSFPLDAVKIRALGPSTVCSLVLIHPVSQFFKAIWTYWCRISGIFNITLIDFDRFTAASIIINSLYAGALAGPGGHTRLFYTQVYYAKDVGTGVPPFPPYLWENSPILLPR